MATETLPTDPYSRRLRELQANPAAVEKTSMIDLVDFYGNSVTWVVKTIRADGGDTVFITRNTAEGGERWVLPPPVTAAIVSQRERATTVNRKRGARRAVATKRAKGVR